MDGISPQISFPREVHGSRHRDVTCGAGARQAPLLGARPRVGDGVNLPRVETQGCLHPRP